MKYVLTINENTIHSSDMSIIQRFLTNQITANEIIIVITPYCPTPQHLLHMQGVNLLSLKTFDESKYNITYTWILFEITLRRITVVRWCTRKWTLGHRRRKRGGGSPISLSNIFYTKPDKKITFFGTIFVVFSLSNELVKENIETNCRSNFVHGLYIGGS